jgi:hypothetical protein
MKEDTVVTTLRLPAELMQRVDSARGNRSRADFLRACIEAGSADERSRFVRESHRQHWFGRGLGDDPRMWRAALTRAVSALTLVGDQDVARVAESPGSWDSPQWAAVQRWLHDQLRSVEPSEEEGRAETMMRAERP